MKKTRCKILPERGFARQRRFQFRLIARDSVALGSGFKLQARDMFDFAFHITSRGFQAGGLSREAATRRKLPHASNRTSSSDTEAYPG
jgi:hypothetical protein